MITLTDRARRCAPVVVALIGAQLILGGCSMFGADGSSRMDGPPLDDAQTRAQVVDPAKQLVEAVGFERFTASFRFGACSDQGRPPYRGITRIAFVFPEGADEAGYLEQIVAAMLADGWQDGPPAGKKPHGRVVHQGAMMAILGGSTTVHPGQGDITIYGECRNPTDRREVDDPPFETITEELSPQR